MREIYMHVFLIDFAISLTNSAWIITFGVFRPQNRIARPNNSVSN